MGPSTGCEKRSVALDNIQGFVICPGLTALESGLDILHLLEYGFCDRLTLIKLRRSMSSERPEAESRVAEIRLLEERMRAMDADMEALCVAHVRVDELTAERASLNAGVEQAQEERDILENRIRELDVDAATRDGAMGGWALFFKLCSL